jgi:hypothetical protein
MNGIRHFPARLLTPTEQALVQDWVALAGDVPSAYVSRRDNDDPALRHRIVVSTNPDNIPTYLVHAPAGRHIWIVFSLEPKMSIRSFRSLRAALNSIRSVLSGAHATKQARRRMVQT